MYLIIVHIIIILCSFQYVYIDDTPIVYKTWKQHVQLLARVVERAQRLDLKVTNTHGDDVARSFARWLEDAL